ncbi:aminotransferase class III-fold pyridoxal phosphate-dependent enzyme, partial [Desulfobacterales bacterium]|nr:aminotransferase class III-fold pyridoxal phosphate-dependent enzyme [Desulfobacterales bacterium]
NPERILLEVGPRATTSTLALQQVKDRQKQLAVPSLSDTAEDDREWQKILYAIGQLWLSGVSIDWNKFYENEDRRRVALPSYPFEQKRFWVDHVYSGVEIKVTEINKSIRSQGEETMTQAKKSNNHPSIRENLIAFVRDIFEEIYGEPIDSNAENVTYFELGFDSLFLTQASLAIKRETGLNISFRQLIEDFPTLTSLSEYLEEHLTDEMRTKFLRIANDGSIEAAIPGADKVQNEINTGNPYEVQFDKKPIHTDQLKDVLAQQLSIISRQLDMIAVISDIPDRKKDRPIDQYHKEGLSGPELNQVSANGGNNDGDQSKTQKSIKKSSKSFGPSAKIDLFSGKKLSGKTLERFNQFVKGYNIRTAKSKTYTQDHRSVLADPRVVSGFSPILKEVTYPIVVDRFSGSKIWDIDGNEYIDVTNGFGSNIFGHSPSFIKEALSSQLDKGIGIGPQHPLAGEVAKLFCELTGHERAAFCNTGSEAVLGAMRIARTVTGRNKIVMFSGSYHGMFDEVIVRGTKKLRSLPAAAGIMPSAVDNIIVLDYGEENSLSVIKEHAHELAAIMVEPIQSRRPDLRPKAFLAELRNISDQAGTALIFDEIVTGFRVRQGGAQEYFSIRADLATYGKVIGGGMPIGVIAGQSDYMNALDGGDWQFGDSSAPEIGVTYFAGTFVRHPLVLAAAKASLEYFKQKGAKFQNDLNEKTEKLISKLQSICRKAKVPIKIEGFSSFFQVSFTETLPYASLLFPWLRNKGVFISEGRGWFLTEAHSDKDLSLVVDAFDRSIVEMQEAGLLPQKLNTQKTKRPDLLNDQAIDLTHDRLKQISDKPPVPGAKLGRDPSGEPGWYLSDPERPGKYLKVGVKDGRI